MYSHVRIYAYVWMKYIVYEIHAHALTHRDDDDDDVGDGDDYV